MLTELELETALDLLQARLDRVNTVYIRKIAEQIKRMGEMNQTSINRMVLMAEMGEDVRDITTQLASAMALNMRDVEKIYTRAMQEVNTDQRFSRYLEVLKDGTSPVSPVGQPVNGAMLKTQLAQFTQAVSMQTQKTMQNLSNTTIISKTYQDAIDEAILASGMGHASYTEAMRDVVSRVGYGGMRVQYPSGRQVRLDSAVRQNIVDGAKQIAQNGAKIYGDALGFNAYELSAHMHSAPDHAPVQGRVFLIAEYEKMQSGQAFDDVDGNHYVGFKRKIGEWNCMHIAAPFDTRVSKRLYTDAQLAQWEAANDAGCEIDGKHYTTYQAGQLMRRIETEVRREKDRAIAAEAAGDETLQLQSQQRINALGNRYTQVCRASGLKSRRQRMVVQGFTPMN